MSWSRKCPLAGLRNGHSPRAHSPAIHTAEAFPERPRMADKSAKFPPPSRRLKRGGLETMRSPRWNCRNAKTPRPLAPASAILNPRILASSFSAAADAPPNAKKNFDICRVAASEKHNGCVGSSLTLLRSREVALLSSSYGSPTVRLNFLRTKFKCLGCIVLGLCPSGLLPLALFSQKTVMELTFQVSDSTLIY